MKKLFLLLALLPVLSFGEGTILSPSGEYELNRSSAVARKYGLGSQIRYGQQFGAVGTWDFALHGGATGTQNLRGAAASEDLVLPAGSIITDCFIDVVTAMTSAANSGKISFGSEAAEDLLSPTNAHTLAGRVACRPSGTEINMLKMTADRTLTVKIGSEALTAGKVKVFIQYVQSETK